MKYETAQIYWHGGMFLGARHFQAMERKIAREGCQQAALSPHGWGVASLEIDNDALEGERFQIKRAALRFKSGVWAKIPDNAEARVAMFDNLMPKTGALPVWAAIKRMEAGQPSVESLDEDTAPEERPFAVREVDAEDENTGGDKKTIQVKVLKVFIFFGTKPDVGYDGIKIGEIGRTDYAEFPVFNTSYIPPLLNIGASSILKERLENIVVRLENQTSVLRREVAEKRHTLTADPANILTNLLRLKIMSSFSLVLGQLQRVDETGPFDVYIELSRLAGELVALFPKTAPDVPRYDHENLTEVMGRLMETVHGMLEGGILPEYAARVFQIEGEVRTCRIDREWLDREYPFHLCIESDQPHESVDNVLSDFRVKICPPSHMEELLRERKRGIEYRRIRRVPKGLEDRSGLHYYRFDLSRKSRWFESLSVDLVIEIRGIPENVIPDMKLYANLLDKQKYRES